MTEIRDLKEPGSFVIEAGELVSIDGTRLVPSADRQVFRVFSDKEVVKEHPPE